jgi:hypothetical protein
VSSRKTNQGRSAEEAPILWVSEKTHDGTEKFPRLVARSIAMHVQSQGL